MNSESSIKVPKKADCVRRVGNMLGAPPNLRFNSASFGKKTSKSESFNTDDLVFEKRLLQFSPKLYHLIEKIRTLDQQDMADHKTHFKHVIFTDLKQGGYTKMVASTLIMNGLQLAYDNKLKLKSPAQLKSKESFLYLCTTSIYGTTIGARKKKELLEMFNSRPENNHGQLCRFVLLDNGSKEGIDLFDVKYIHILEPQISNADQKQVIGRGTRLCGQSGLKFDPVEGWPLNVFIYDMLLDPSRAELYSTQSLHQYFLRIANIDVLKQAFAPELERVARIGSVDYSLNKNIHEFKKAAPAPMEGGETPQPRCDKDCGKRANKYMPYNIAPLMLIAVLSKVKIPTEKKLKEMDITVRDYLCRQMKTNDTFCSLLKSVWGNEREYFKEQMPALKKAFKTAKYKSIGYRKRISIKNYLVKKLNLEAPFEIILPAGKSEKDFDGDDGDENVEEEESNVKSPEASISPKSPNVSPNTPIVETPAHIPKDPNYPLDMINNKRLGFEDMRKYVDSNFSKYKWDEIQMENMCAPKSESSSNGASSSQAVKKLLDFTPTQSFIQNYFRPSIHQKGMLLYHSVGTGKTCTGIATATAEFEKQGYTILWVTRGSLKNDIWKNMFKQVCHNILRRKIEEEGLKVPTEFADQVRLLSKSWTIRPMSYKQFSNLITKSNKLYDDLVEINGSKDIFRKTLIIIDEAHKLYSPGDLLAQERPNMDIFEKAIQKSYVVSGKDSAKLLMMTATPFGVDPMDMMKLLNLIIEHSKEDTFPTDFNEFQTKYPLTPNGLFQEESMMRFLDDISGLVSYLNREKDARQFSQPNIRLIQIPMTGMDAIRDEVKMMDKRMEDLSKSDALWSAKNDSDMNMIAARIKELKSKEYRNSLCGSKTKQDKKDCVASIDREVQDYSNKKQMLADKKRGSKDREREIKLMAKQIKAGNKDLKLRLEKTQEYLMLNKCMSMDHKKIMMLPSQANGAVAINNQNRSNNNANAAPGSPNNTGFVPQSPVLNNVRPPQPPALSQANANRLNKRMAAMDRFNKMPQFAPTIRSNLNQVKNVREIRSASF